MSRQTPSDKALVSLKKLADLTKLPINELLHKGGNGELRFCVPIPAETVVFTIDRHTFEMEQSANNILSRKKLSQRIEEQNAPRRQQLDFLVLSKSDCLNLEKFSGHSQDLFDSGLALDSCATITEVIPPDSSKRSSSGIGISDAIRQPIYAIYSVIQPSTHPTITSLGYPYRIPLSLDALLAFNLDLEEFIASNRRATLVRPQPWTSDYLVWMLQASQSFWRSRYRPDTRWNKPFSITHDDAIAFFMRKGLSRNQAKAAASMIRPIETRGNSVQPDMAVTLTFETPELIALFAASEHFWKDWDSRFPDDAPNNELIAQWLIDNHGLSASYLAKIAPSLIRRDETRRRQGKPKKPK